jgi:membrane protease YdiL (CAAX protease family)
VGVELWIRTFGPVLLAFAVALVVDELTRRRGLEPPGFRPAVAGGGLAAVRRALGLAVLAAVLWIGVFGPLGTVGSGIEPDLSRVPPGQLFLLHGVFAAALGLWYLLGFAGTGGSWTAQLGFRARQPLTEVGLGLVAGIGGWLVVISALAIVVGLIWTLGGERLLPERPPPLIPWLVALPVWLRLAVSLSAGVVEEAFFRGFLQPRVGIALSTALFALAHAGYEQPLMLVGIVLLSLLFAHLVRWRQNIWPAVAAHALFNAVQLLVVVPTALELSPGAGPLAAAAVAFW